jgi:hypothetical protein
VRMLRLEAQVLLHHRGVLVQPGYVARLFPITGCFIGCCSIRTIQNDPSQNKALLKIT